MSEKTDKEKVVARMDLYMSAIVAASLTDWRETEPEPDGAAFDFDKCIDTTLGVNQLRGAADLARQSIEAVDASVEFDKKCDTVDRLDKVRERRGLGTICPAEGFTL
jgi:hypothetical protein